MFGLKRESPKTISMRLKCGNCGHTAKHELGCIFVSPGEGESTDPADCVSFGDYFRCAKCGSGWPWVLTPQAHLALSALMVGHLNGIEEERLILAEPRLFDGFAPRSGAQAEEHLLDVLERDPKNAFVWNRLGNIYLKAELTSKAEEAFARALAIDPNDVESHYSLGSILHARGLYQEAATHLHEVITRVRGYRKLPGTKLRELVDCTLDLLAEIADRTNNEIPVFPPVEPQPPANSEEPVVVYLTEFDLADGSDRDRLIDWVLGEGFASATPRQAPARRTRIGRNEPCPCGSGKKYKRCCGAGR